MRKGGSVLPVLADVAGVISDTNCQQSPPPLLMTMEKLLKKTVSGVKIEEY
jgi:hypothetical protein